MALSRRDFIERTGSLLGLGPLSLPLLRAPWIRRSAAPWIRRSAVEPVVIASANGYWFRNGGKETCVELAWRMMTEGRDVLDALIAGVTILELDPEEPNVGYGGLPNAEGVVQLDASCMHGPRHGAGGVAALEGVRTPARVAQLVMERTPNHLLAGAGAQEFARKQGFTIEADLNTEYSRNAWREWKRRSGPQSLAPELRVKDEERILDALYHEGILRSRAVHGTINCLGINARADICGVTTTSGLAFKIPGRVGDSPILGAGLYVDGAAGAAGSTGVGELNLYNLSSYQIVENLRRGMHPKDAGLDALARVRRNTIDPARRRTDGNPNFQLAFYVLNARGEHAGVAMYAEDDDLRGAMGNQDRGWLTYSVCDRNGPRHIVCEGLIPGKLQA